VRLRDDPRHDGIEVIQHIASGDAQSRNLRRGEPRIARGIMALPGAVVMPAAIDLDGQTGIHAIEIENIGAAWMLATKFQSARSLPQRLPDQYFGQGHRSPQLPRRSRRALSCLGRPVSQHRTITPPPCFAWSPSPRQARGGITGDVHA